MADWSEEGALPGKLILSFQGVNSDALERIEVENFQRGLSAPAADDPGGTAYGTGRGRGMAMTPRQGLGVVLAVILAFSGYSLGDSLGVDDGVKFGLTAAGFVVGLAAIPLGFFLLQRRADVRGVIMTEPFVVEATDGAMIVRGATIGAVTIPIGDIAEILAAPRLGWRDRQGKFTAFPCGAREKVKNVALAARLQEIVVQIRAMSGYRGG